MKELVDIVLAPGDVDARLAAASAARKLSPDASPVLDRALIRRLARMEQHIEAAEERITEVLGAIEALTAEPHFPARVVDPDAGPGLVAVSSGQGQCLVAFGPEAAGPLSAGDRVWLGPKRNVILRVADSSTPREGQVAVLLRILTPESGLVEHRGETFKAQIAARVTAADEPLREGDSVLYAPEHGMVLERLGRDEWSDRFRVEVLPKTGFESVGGLDSLLGEPQETLLLSFRDPDAVRRFGLRPARGVLMVGPPGVGKTLVARALAHELGRHGSGPPRFLSVPGGELLSEWYGRSGRNVRALFAYARRLAGEDPSPLVVFLDEMDGIAGARGRAYGGADDRVVAALLQALDGFEDPDDCPNLVVVAATNREDVLDPAILRPGRLGDLVLNVPRPDREAAREIFEVHLPEDLPFHDGVGRTEVVAGACSRIYARNGLGPLARLTFRDGTTRELRPPDLISGAIIQNACRGAARTAASRSADGMAPFGVTLADLHLAVEADLRNAARRLTPRNVHLHLTSLPADADVARVEAMETDCGSTVLFRSVA